MISQHLQRLNYFDIKKINLFTIVIHTKVRFCQHFHFFLSRDRKIPWGVLYLRIWSTFYFAKYYHLGKVLHGCAGMKNSKKELAN